MALEVVPTRLERLELERVARIAKAPRTRSERAQAFQADPIYDMHFSGEVALTVVCEAASYLKAMKSLENPMWEATIQVEYRFLTSNSTWDLMPYSRDVKVIGSMWKFKSKRDSKGNISKYKARLVARGEKKQPDWNSVFAPTMRYTSLRVIMALACYTDWEIEQMDGVNAFLNADVESNIYIEEPQGVGTAVVDGTRLVYHLKKRLFTAFEKLRKLRTPS